MYKSLSIQLIRLPEVCASQGKCKSSIYNEINSGLFPPPIRITSRNSAWPSTEIEAITRARIAGKNELEIKKLVKKLVADRISGGLEND